MKYLMHYQCPTQILNVIVKLIVIEYEYSFLEGKIYCFHGLNMLAGNCDLIDPNVKIKKKNIILASAFTQFGPMLHFKKC